MAFNPLSVEVVAEIPGMPEYKSQREYFKPMLITDYEKIFIKYKKLEEDDKEYEKIKKLYKKWSEAKKKII